MRVSRRCTRVAGMELTELLRVAERVKAIDIALGIPAADPPAPVVDAAVAALRAGRHQYADPAGLPELRAALAAGLRRTHGIDVDPATELTITCGATEALFATLLAVTDPGDEVVVVQPCYESYVGMVELVGAVPVVVGLRTDGWRLDPADLAAAVSARTRAIILNTPHNPTGRVFDAAEVGGVLRLCRERGLVCVTDEVYDHYVFDGARHRSPLSLPGGREHVVLAGSLSKTLNATGWRIGFCVADPATTSAIRRVHERTTIGTNRPMQHGAAALALDSLGDNRSWVQQQRDLMVDRLTAMGFAVFRPEGGWFLMADTRPLGVPAGALCRDLVERAGVLVAPGETFFAEGGEDRWLRMTFVRDPAATRDALDRIERFLADRTG
ncbi:pyridoxal phosphate-dependent aminotransferase [Labedaea rhizosphaerae]|uniref:Aminotransferase n=1 Tax=Labedaea rhizosphaerae TaxID=598644 RepID=A0A4R6SFK8_LABRH|nr:pyridoxal phosphate-dependent aminotransferase [Labedaea rhizosphaerae]TDQ00483.1 N-succinyldiaminopimelate aminotransferase [Labedaea rhizosphaerae]